MKIYKRHTHADGSINFEDVAACRWIPLDDRNPIYVQMLAEVAAGTAVIEDAVAPDPPPPVILPCVASKLINARVDITEQTAWQALGGVAVNASFFTPDLTQAFGIVQFDAKAVGTTAQLRLVEVDEDGNARALSDLFVIPESNKWRNRKFQTSQVPGSGDYVYEIQGRLNGATSALIRYCSVVLVRFG